mgnify:FL=1
MALKITIIVIFALAVLALSGWYLVPKFLEQPSYKVMLKDGKIEIRQYDRILLQSVKVRGDQYQSIRQGFRPLVRFIGGKDRDGDKISMTAPVIQSAGDNEDDWVISFSMPSKYDIANLPAPQDSSIYTENLEPMTAAVIKFSGKANEQILRNKTQTLLLWLEQAGYEVQSKPKYLFYNDPSTPGFLRRNEVMVQVN